MDEKALTIIARALEQSRKNSLFLLLLMAGFMLSVPFMALIHVEENRNIYYAILTIAFMFFGSLTLMVGLRYRKLMDPGTSPIMRAINTPGVVVWFYEKEIENSFLVYLYMSDGKSEYFHVDPADTPPLLDALEKQLPDAVRGYSKENKKLYKKDPAEFGKRISRGETS